MDQQQMSRASSTFKPCTLEINVISAEDLIINGRPINKNVIVYVHTSTRAEGVSTTVNSNLIWHEKVELKMSGYAREIIVQVRSGINLIGEAKIPSKEIFEDYAPPNCLHLLSYRLRDRQSNSNGIINLSIRAKDYYYS